MTDPTPETIAELRRLAESATPGPWEWDDDHRPARPPRPDPRTEGERTMTTIRKYAHELYPHAEEGETRPLVVEVPYLYAQAIGLNVWGTGWSDVEPRQLMAARTQQLVYARREAFMADAMLQGLTGDEAWTWADRLGWDETGEWAYERATHYGVPVDRIKPYPCGPEPEHHHHMASTGDVTGHGRMTSIHCRESECPSCTEPTEDHR